jgi:peptide/nickel transport system permease protein
MQNYIIRRLLLAIPTLLIASSLVFIMIRMAPGDVMLTVLGESMANTPNKDIEQVRHDLGLDAPIHVQYMKFIAGVTQGDLGKSLRDKRPVRDEIKDKLPVTIELAVLALLWSLVIAIPIGVISAIRQDTFLDYLFRSIAVAGISLPSFWLGTLAVILPAIWFHKIPSVVYTSLMDDPFTNLKQMALPALILGTLLAGTVMRITRTMMLEVMRQDYIRTAMAKGLHEKVVIYRHALRNALIPVVTVLGLQVAFLIGGTVVIENIFSLPGMGQLFIEALNWRDYPVIQGLNVVVASWVVIVNIIVDISYGFLDPRIRYS